MTSTRSIRQFIADLRERVSEPTPDDAAPNRHIYDPVNVYSGFADQEDEAEEYGWDSRSNNSSLPAADGLIPPQPSLIKRFVNRLRIFFVRQQEWFFLLVLGVCSAILALTMEETMQSFYDGARTFRLPVLLILADTGI